MTSLAEQLNRLKVPQTSILLQDKKKPSLLFDPREAAELDRRTVYNLGLQGLQELIELNKRFAKFENSLFSESSISLERAVRNNKENAKLDAEISEFLVLVSPYFLINSTHKALEWLVHRFHIHEYNKDAFLMLIIPYHESRMFIRALQLTNLFVPGDKWLWLSPLQKLGQPLGLLVFLKHLCTDKSLLKIISDHVIFATQTYSTEANCLSTLYSFYTQSFVGWLSQSHSVSEIQINYILPSLLCGLSSSIANFSAGIYMILAQMMKRIQLIESDANIILLKIVKQPILKVDALLMIIYIYSNPYNHVESMSNKFMMRLVKTNWFIESLARVKKIGAKTETFITTFFKVALEFVIENDQRIDDDKCNDVQLIKSVVKQIIDDIRLESAEVEAILSVARDSDLVKVEQNKDFFVDIFAALERGYPVVFDAFLKKLMELSEGMTQDTRKALRFLTTWHTGSHNVENTLDVICKLNHFSPQQRIAGLNALADKRFKINEALRVTLVDALLARFDDEEPQVVNALLSIPIQKLKQLTSIELVDKLLILIFSCHTKRRRFLGGAALNILLNVHRSGDELAIFLATLPFLFPIHNAEVEVAMKVLNSEFASKNAYMTAIKQDIQQQQSAENIRSVAFHHLLNRSLLPESNAILACIEEEIMGTHDAASFFFNMMVLGSICRVQVGCLKVNEARKSIELIAKMMTFPKVQRMPQVTQINSENLLVALRLTENDVLPLQAATYVLEMVHRRLDINSNSMINFEKSPERSELILRLIEIYFQGLSNFHWREHYQWCLKIFFQRHFKSVKDLLIFLSRFFIKPVKVETSYHCLQIVLSLLGKCKSIAWIFEDNVFVPHLLLALTSSEVKCRETALEIVQSLTATFNLNTDGFFVLLHEILKHKNEISMDEEQLSIILYMLLSPDPDVTHRLKNNRKEKLAITQKNIFEILLENDMPVNIISQLLQLLVHVNSVDILRSLVPLGKRFLLSNKNEFEKNALKYIILRFNSNTVKALNYEPVWQLFENLISKHDIMIQDENDQSTVSSSIIVMRQIDETFFLRLSNVSPKISKKLLAKLIDIVTYCNISDVVTIASRVVRRIRIDAQFIVEELQKMLNQESQVQQKSRLSDKARRSSTFKRRSYIPTSPEVVNTNEWKRGQTILEFIQDSNNVDNEHLLVPILLDLLKMCLNFEEQNPLEYTNQLVLSTLYYLVKKNSKLMKADAHLHIGLIAQCIRTSRNPQTHHHALLLLVELFKVADIQAALHQVMQIFTFMGNSVLRQDDAYSIQIITKTIETIVPIISETNNENHACELLRIFVTSLPDIPEHRRRPLFCKLLQQLQNYLHLYYLLSLDSHIRSPKEKETTSKIDLKLPSETLDFALQMSQEFGPKDTIGVCVKLVEFLHELPVNLEDVPESEKRTFRHNHIFNLRNSTSRDLKYMKYVTIQFLTALLSAPEFINKIAGLPYKESMKMKSDYDQLIIKLVLLIGSTAKMLSLFEKATTSDKQSKYWMVMLRHQYDALDRVNNLLPNSMFLKTVKRLMHHELPVVRRKSLELLNTRLHQKIFSDDDHDELLDLIDPLMEVIRGPKTNNQELEIIQQHALVGLKFLAKLLATKNQEAFIPVLQRTTKLLKNREGPVLANSALCVAELCSSIGAYAVQSLNKFFPQILKLIDSHCCLQVPDVTVLSIVSSVQKIIESVGNFISKDDLDQLLIRICKLSSFYANSEHPKVEMIMARVKTTTQKLSSNTPPRILLPSIDRTYNIIIQNKNVNYISPLMAILAESFHTIQSSDLKTLVFSTKEQDLMSFFLNVFEFREQVTKINVEVSLEEIVVIEESARKALVSLVLKLSETTFRPLYYKFYDWAARNPSKKNRNITFYRLSANIAQCLKSLFVLFAGHFVKHAADLLAENQQKNEDDLSEEDVSYKIELTDAILLTLMQTFEHDAHDFVNQERFDTLMKPIVDQLENFIENAELYEKRVRELIVPCIAAFASAISDDSLHNQLVYHIILKSSHEKLHVRIAVLNSLVEIARKLGKDFMPLLLEIIPMLNEMQEDEEMEKSVHNAIWAFEDILEQPLQKYLK